MSKYTVISRQSMHSITILTQVNKKKTWFELLWWCIRENALDYFFLNLHIIKDLYKAVSAKYSN